MLSNLNCTATLLEDDLLSFDDLLDIAREYEFTRTITHLWPCEDDHSTLSETGLDDVILATISSPPTSQENPLFPLTESLKVHLDPSIHIQELRLDRPVSRHLHQILLESDAPATSMLRGWSPPNGSQFLDLDDDSFMLPRSKSQSSMDSWIPPWPTTFCPNATSQPQCTTDTNQLLPMVSKSGDATREPVRSRSAQYQGSTPHTAKPPKSRPVFGAGASSSATYARPPRGGIPPHIARSVMKATILRAEKESQVIRNACSSNTITGDRKKPSVLRGSTAIEKENTKTENGCDSGTVKKLYDARENGGREGRATKRVRV